VSVTREDLQLRFRPMLRDDIEYIQQIDALSFSLPWPKSSFEFELNNPSSRTRVAEIVDQEGKARLVGMICIWVIMDEAHIATIAVHPDFRQQGIGKKLLAHTLLEAAGEGVKLAYLEVRRGNLAAQIMYARFGFTTVGVRSRYYADNHEDALMMNLERMDISLLKQIAAGEST
jgi:ribosomal-protein-alanine N-acetyltransferase